MLLHNYFLSDENKIVMSQRANILKFQGLLHLQFRSPRFRNLFKYAWFAAGYSTDRPGEFITPTKYCFPILNGNCQVDNCIKRMFIRCSWCKSLLCLKHFFVNYHNCNEFIE